MELWITATIAAALFQNLRFMLQKVLSNTSLTPVGATWSRFVYSAPVILGVLWVTFGVAKIPVPEVTNIFWLAGVIGGLCQIMYLVDANGVIRYRHVSVLDETVWAEEFLPALAELRAESVQ